MQMYTWKFHILFVKNHLSFHTYLNSEEDWMMDSNLFLLYIRLPCEHWYDVGAEI